MKWTTEEILAAMTDTEALEWECLLEDIALSDDPEPRLCDAAALAARVGARLAVEETEIMATLRIGTELHFFDRETLKELVSETGAKVRYVRAPYPEEPER